MTDFSRKFPNGEQRERLRVLILSGVPYLTIASQIGCNHSSVIYHARKFGIPPRPRYHPIVETGERINPGHSYKEIMYAKGYVKHPRRGWIKNNTQVVHFETLLVDNTTVKT